MTRKSIFASILTVLFLFASSPANAALNAYLTLAGKQTGAINGSVTQRGRENQIMVIAVDMTSSMPYDIMGGQATGRGTHSVLTITKELDAASIGLRKAFAINDVLSTFELKFWTPQLKATAGTGQEVQNFTISLTNARVVAVRFRMQNNKNPDLMKYAESEDVSFTFEKITWTYIDGNGNKTTFSDNWSSGKL